jgi:hypothetical protein
VPNLLSLALLLLFTSGCRITTWKEVQLPTEGPTFRVECRYEFNNCAREAARRCPRGRYEQLTRKNCPRCGRLVPLNPQANAPIQMSSYYGTLYYRCM